MSGRDSAIIAPNGPAIKGVSVPANGGVARVFAVQVRNWLSITRVALQG